MRYAFFDVDGRVTFAANDDTVQVLPDGAVELTATQWEERLSLRAVNGVLTIDPPGPDSGLQTPDEIAAAKERLIDEHIITVLAEREYDGPNALAKYQGLTDAQIASLAIDEQDDAARYRAECQTAALWITRVWIKANRIMADVQAEARLIPTDEELIAELPVLAWPT